MKEIKKNYCIIKNMWVTYIIVKVLGINQTYIKGRAILTVDGKLGMFKNRNSKVKIYGFFTNDVIRYAETYEELEESIMLEVL